MALSIPQPTQADRQFAASVAARYSGQLYPQEVSRLAAQIIDTTTRFRRVIQFHGLRPQKPELSIFISHPDGSSVNQARVAVQPPTDRNGQPLGGLHGAVSISEIEQIRKPGLVSVPGQVGISD